MPTSVNKTQLRNLLLTPPLHQETIYGVIGRMEVLLDFFGQEPRYHNLIPFLKTYYFVTKASAEKFIRYKHYFSSPRDYELLDVTFARLYFDPLLRYLENREYTTPWKQYFHYCEQEDAKPLLKILLGINAHINTDLYTALVQLRYHHQHDFLLVNEILWEVTPSVMRFLLVSEHDILGVSGVFMKNMLSTVLQKVFARWRQTAWENAMLTHATNKEDYYAQISQTTEQIGRKLIADMEGRYVQHPQSLLTDLFTLSTKLT